MPKLTVVAAPEAPGAPRSTLAELEVPPDRPLFFVLQESGVSVASACGGKAQCGLCRITVIEGWDSLTAPVEVEETHLGNLMHLAHTRLSCQTRMIGEATIEVPRFESKEDRMRRKANARRLSAERAEARGASPGRGPGRGPGPRGPGGPGGSPGAPGGPDAGGGGTASPGAGGAGGAGEDRPRDGRPAYRGGGGGGRGR